jgi:hypothetical protein
LDKVFKIIKFEGVTLKSNSMKKILLVLMLLGILVSSNAQSDTAWVDMGLSVKWATCNVGATSPEDFGESYPFAEVYGNYRIPTLAEIWELVDQCDWEWVEQNGHYGCKVTSPKTKQSIFFPAAGMVGADGPEEMGTSGYYWFKVADIEECYMKFVSDEIFLQTNKTAKLFRYYVRLVSDN